MRVIYQAYLSICIAVYAGDCTQNFQDVSRETPWKFAYVLSNKEISCKICRFLYVTQIM